MLPMATRFGDLRLNTLSWCRRTRISNCDAARDRNSPATAHQTNPQRSPIGAIIDRFARSRQPLWVSGRDSRSDSFGPEVAIGRNASLARYILSYLKGGQVSSTHYAPNRIVRDLIHHVGTSFSNHTFEPLRINPSTFSMTQNFRKHARHTDPKYSRLSGFRGIFRF
jgi:hypothetical protein